MGLHFEWDDNKARLNLKNHGIGFDEGATVFVDPLARIFDDEAHSSAEAREIVIGHSAHDRLLLVCFTERGDVIRIISARKATRKERNDYEENAFN
ncbi:MAG: BrnT family toxin [Methanobacteriota archaeon]|nr:MAG: BrnT family toxin [Euryarchaeota archaeon]